MKDKIIEEMAKVLEFCCNSENIENCNSDRSCDSCRAKYLYNVGYRKIPEGAVVLTREELEEILVNYVPQSCIDEICKEIIGEKV